MIVSIGEALIDFKGQEYYVGGCPLNTAVAAARLGVDILFLGGISSDILGEKILSFANDNNVKTDSAFCNDSARTMTTKAVSVNGVNTYNFDYIGTSAFSITAEKLEQSFVENGNISCVFTGSVSFADPKTREEITEAVDSLYQPIIYFDPNIRENLVDDMNVYLKAVIDFAGRSDIVKVSDDDLETIGLTPLQFLAKCKTHLIITHGADGSTWYEKGCEPVFVPAAKPWHKVVDTIGCGDCYNGAVLAWLDKRGKFDDFRISATDKKLAMEFASECSAYNCTREGCNPPYDNEITA